MSFNERLKSVIKRQKSHLCIGLDVNPQIFPESVNSSDNPVVEFNKQIIRYTEDLTAAFKLNLAFYEALGKESYNAIKETLSLIPQNVLKIADAKRGDIGTSSEMYAKAIFDDFGFDAITVNAYMGYDSIEPFLKYRDKGIFVLVATSNPGASDFQRIETSNGNPFYIELASKLTGWNKNSNIGMVLGATHITELENAVSAAPGLPCLIPGVGKQGGDSNEVRDVFADNESEFIVNSSRGIIYASNKDDYASKAREAAKKLRDGLN